MARRPRGASVTQTIGGVLVGFDEQVWSRRPPAQERVEQVDRVRTVVASEGLTIELPADERGLAPVGPEEHPQGAQGGPREQRRPHEPGPHDA